MGMRGRTRVRSARLTLDAWDLTSSNDFYFFAGRDWDVGGSHLLARTSFFSLLLSDYYQH